MHMGPPVESTVSPNCAGVVDLSVMMISTSQSTRLSVLCQPFRHLFWNVSLVIPASDVFNSNPSASLLVQATKCESASPLFPRHKFVPASWIRTGPVGEADGAFVAGNPFYVVSCERGLFERTSDTKTSLLTPRRAF